ncbi:MAG TPA: polymerase, partial [Allocoleopsis sp.]
MSNLFQLLLSKHPSSNLQIVWNIWLINFTIFPILPTWGSVGLSVVVLMIFKQQYKHIISQKFNKIIGIFSLLIFFLSCFAYKPEESFLGLHNFLLYFLAFICFSILIQTPLQLIKIAENLLIGSIPVIILGLGQLFLNWQTPDFLVPLFGWKLHLLGNPIGRMSSVFMYANILAVYLIIVFALGLGLLFINFQQPKKRLYYLILLIFIAIALILTNSRNAWIIMILSCLIWAIYQQWYWLLGIFTAISSIILTAAFAPISIAEIFRKIVPKFIWA